MFFPEPIAREFAPPPPLRVTPARRLFAAITNAGADRVLFSPGGGWLRHNGAMRARTSTLHTYTYADALEALTRELAALKLARAVGHLYGEQAGPRIGLIGHQSVTGRLSQTANPSCSCGKVGSCRRPLCSWRPRALIWGLCSEIPSRGGLRCS